VCRCDTLWNSCLFTFGQLWWKKLVSFRLPCHGAFLYSHFFTRISLLAFLVAEVSFIEHQEQPLRHHLPHPSIISIYLPPCIPPRHKKDNKLTNITAIVQKPCPQQPAVSPTQSTSSSVHRHPNMFAPYQRPLSSPTSSSPLNVKRPSKPQTTCPKP